MGGEQAIEGIARPAQFATTFSDEHMGHRLVQPLGATDAPPWLNCNSPAGNVILGAAKDAESVISSEHPVVSRLRHRQLDA